MKKINLGITGQSGFIGSWLYRKASAAAEFNCIDFSRGCFACPNALREFTGQCDAIVHLAGISRHADGEYLYRTNVELTEQLISSCSGKQTIYLGSTTHEKETPYHASKRKSAELLKRYGNSTILKMANTFGPGSKPFYNSVVSTFCRMAADGTEPEQIDDVRLRLIFVDDLCQAILELIRNGRGEICAEIPHTTEYPLPRLWNRLREWKRLEPQELPHFSSLFEAQLYFTFRSYRNLR